MQHLGAAFARIWTLDDDRGLLPLQASAGQYTHLKGRHGRVPLGQLKIGLIAQERRPVVTNDVIHDPKINDRAWAAREGMVAFAGHPLVVDDRVVGVMALFSRQRLTDCTLDDLAAIADVIAKANGVGIGLSISRTIISQWDGRLWATPDAGLGTTFSFTLPGVLRAPHGV